MSMGTLAEKRLEGHLDTSDLKIKGRDFGESTWEYGYLDKYSILTHFVHHFAFMINVAFLERHLSDFYNNLSPSSPAFQMQCLVLPG